MGGAFAKAMSGKKDDFVKALLNVAAFPHEGQGAAVDALQHRVRQFLSTHAGTTFPARGVVRLQFSLWRYHHVFQELKSLLTAAQHWRSPCHRPGKD